MRAGYLEGRHAKHLDSPQFHMAAPPLMKNMHAAGLLGRKSGKGFYDWSSGKAK